jgi:hypothetical protein
VLTRKFKAGGADESFRYVEQQLLSNASFARECHPLLHHLGHEAYVLAGGFDTAMEKSNELCNSGFIHGVIEAHITEADDKKAAIASTCTTGAAENYAAWQCYHGLGHGAMFASGRDVSGALALCTGLNSEFARGSCANGAFMEAFITESHSGAHKNHEDIPGLELCKQQKAYISDCYFYAPTSYLGMHANDYTGAFEWCSGAQKEYTLACVGGVGAQAMKENVLHPGMAAGVCSSAPSGYRTSCVSSAIGIYINHRASSASAKPLCDNEFKTYKETCQRVIRSRQESLQI